MRSKAWPRHTPGRKETGPIAQKNRPIPVESSIVGPILIPLKRKYLTYRAYMQQPKQGGANAPAKQVRAYFPLGRIRAIKSSLAG